MSTPTKEEISAATRKGLFRITAALLIIALVALLLLQFSTLQVELQPLLAHIDWMWVLGGWGLMCLALWLLGYRWRALLPANTPVSGLFLGAALCSALLLNYALPGPAGELASAWLVRRRTSLSFERILAAGAVARLIGLTVAAVGTVLIWSFFTFPLPEGWLWPMQLGVCSILGGAILLIALLVRPSWWRSLLSGGAYSGLLGKVSAVLLRFIDAMIETAQQGPLAYLKAVFWSVVGHLTALLGIVCSLYGLLHEYDFWGTVFTYCTATSAGALAFLFPGSQLPWDALFAAVLFSTTQFSLLEAGAAAALLRSEQLCMMALGAVVTWLLLRSFLYEPEESS
jgi:hypothetical protein